MCGDPCLVAELAAQKIHISSFFFVCRVDNTVPVAEFGGGFQHAFVAQQTAYTETGHLLSQLHQLRWGQRRLEAATPLDHSLGLRAVPHLIHLPSGHWERARERLHFFRQGLHGAVHSIREERRNQRKPTPPPPHE